MDQLRTWAWHDALLWAGGLVPDPVLGEARSLLAARRHLDVARTVLGALSGDRPLDPDLHRRLETALEGIDPGPLPPLPSLPPLLPAPDGEAAVAPSAWTFASALRAGGDPLTVPVDLTGGGGPASGTGPEVRSLVEVVSGTPGVEAVWQSWRLPGPGGSGPVRIVIVIAGPGLPDPMLPELAVYLPLVIDRPGGPACLADVYRSGHVLSPYQRAARAGAALLWVAPGCDGLPEVVRHRALTAVFSADLTAPEPEPQPEPLPESQPQSQSLPEPQPEPQPLPLPLRAVGSALPPPRPPLAPPDLPAWRPEPLPPAGPPAGPAGGPPATPQPVVPVAGPEPAAVVAASAGAPAAVPASAGWKVVVARAAAADREVLRAVLGWRFDAHSRVVSGLVSVDPRLRLSGRSDEDLVAGLIAVRAYLLGDVGLDAHLRGGAPAGAPLAPEAAEVFARCVQSGLSRLPVLRGPVVCAARVGPGLLRSYLPGTTVVEPSFTLASTRAAPACGATVRYGIWSSSARRVDGLVPASPGSGSPAVFPAGTRFAVLSTEPPAGDGGAAAVLLREIFPADRPAGTGAASGAPLDRLREVLAAPPSPASPPPGSSPPAPAAPDPLPAARALGIRDDGAPFDVTRPP